MDMNAGRLAKIREFAFVLTLEKTGRAHDTINNSKRPLTPRQWLGIYEDAADAVNNALDAISAYLNEGKVQNYPLSLPVLTARLLEERGQEIDEIGGIELMQRLPKIIRFRGTSIHQASVLDRVGNEPVATQALDDAEGFIDWVQESMAELLDLDQTGRPR